MSHFRGIESLFYVDSFMLFAFTNDLLTHTQPHTSFVVRWFWETSVRTAREARLDSQRLFYDSGRRSIVTVNITAVHPANMQQSL